MGFMQQRPGNAMPLRRRRLRVVGSAVAGGVLYAALTTVSAAVADIVYDLIPPPIDSNGFGFSGSIITDGSIGVLHTNNILGWNVTTYNRPLATQFMSGGGPDGSSVTGSVIADGASISIQSPFAPALGETAHNRLLLSSGGGGVDFNYSAYYPAGGNLLAWEMELVAGAGGPLYQSNNFYSQPQGPWVIATAHSAISTPPQPAPALGPTNSTHHFVAGIQPSFSWTPLSLEPVLALAVPGEPVIDFHPDYSFFPTVNPTIAPLEHSFTVNDDSFLGSIEGAVLSKISPMDLTQSAKATLGVQGGLSVQGGVYLDDGKNVATVSANASVGASAFAEVELEGGIRDVPYLGSIIPNKFRVDLPLAPSIDLGSKQFASVPIGYDFSYLGFKDIIHDETGISVPNLEGTVTVGNVDVTFDDAKREVFVGISASAGISLSTSASFSLHEYLHEVTEPSAVPGITQGLSTDNTSHLSLSTSQHVTSTTGTVTVGQDDSFSLKTGSPVWINFDISPITSFNQIIFDAQFNSNDVGDGVLGIYLDGYYVGQVDEADGGVGLESYVFDLGGAMQGPGDHILGFRLDPTGTDQSSVNISNAFVANVISTSPVPEPASLGILGMGSLSLFGRHRVRRRKNASAMV